MGTAREGLTHRSEFQTRKGQEQIRELRRQEGKEGCSTPMPAVPHGWRLSVRKTATAVYSGLQQAPDTVVRL